MKLSRCFVLCFMIFFVSVVPTVAQTNPCASDVCSISMTIKGYPNSYSACVCGNLPYGAHAQQRLDIYKPPGSGPFPVIIWVHGGGFKGNAPGSYCGFTGRAFNIVDRNGVEGEIWPDEDWAGVLRQVTRGYAVVSIDYHDAGLDIPSGNYIRFDTLVHDVQQAIRWVKWKAGNYHFNASGIALWGHSAGATLVTLASAVSAVNDQAVWDFGGGDYTRYLVNYNDSANLVLAYSGLYDFNQVLDYANYDDWLLHLVADGASDFLGCDHYAGSNMSGTYPSCKPNGAIDPPPYADLLTLAPLSPLRLASPIVWAGVRGASEPPTLLVYGADDPLLLPATQSIPYYTKKVGLYPSTVDFLMLPIGSSHGAFGIGYPYWNSGTGTNKNGSPISIRNYVDWVLAVYIGVGK